MGETADWGRYGLTAILIVFWFANGLGSSLVGPTLPDQAVRLGVELQQVAYVYSVSGVFSILASLVNGVLADLFPRYSVLLCVCMMLMGGCAVCARSYATTLPAFILCAVFANYGIMGADCIGNTLIFRVWGEAASPPLHLVHGFFGVGSVIGPFMAAPFLSPDTAPNTTCVSNTSFTDCSSMEYPFLIAGSLMLLAGVSLALIHVTGTVRERLAKATVPATSLLNACSPTSCGSTGPLAGSIVLLVSFCLMYFFLLGTQFIVSAYFFTYLTEREDDPFTKQEGSVMMGCYNGAFLLGRLSASGISSKVPIKVMVLTEVIVSAISSAGLFWLGSKYVVALWVFFLIIGGFSAPIWPGGITFLGQYLVVTAMTFFVLTLGMGCGNFFFNWLVGFIFQEYSVEDILLVVLLCYILVVCMTLAMLIVGSRVKRQQQKNEKDPTGGAINDGFDNDQCKEEITRL